MAWTTTLVTASHVLKALPEESRCKKIVVQLAKTANTNKLFRFAASQLTNPLRMTAYCTLATGGVLLTAATGGAASLLLPAGAALSFGLGNFLQSSTTIQTLRNKPNINPMLRALTHSAIWYGLGYTLTGVSIGGGATLLTAPLSNLAATTMTAVGVTEILCSLGFMMSGKVANQASPSMGVAVGTACIAAAGIATTLASGDMANLKGVATGLAACGGEVSVAVFLQQLHNKTYSGSFQGNRIERLLTAPVRAAMKRGWIISQPSID